jgi:hypothetical protein
MAATDCISDRFQIVSDGSLLFRKRFADTKYSMILGEIVQIAAEMSQLCGGT